MHHDNFKSLPLAFLLLTAMAFAAPAYASCYWWIDSVAYITTYGNVSMPDGTTSKVPLFTSVHVHWNQTCNWDDPIFQPAPGEVTGTAQTRLTVQNLAVNTVDPERPFMTADVASTDANYPPAEVLLLINGYRYTARHADGNGRYSLAMPPIREFGDGTTAVDVEVCDSASRCALGNAALWKSTPSPARAATTLNVWRYEGDDLVRAAYGHEFKQVYARTTFSVPEEGENSRYQLKENIATLAWPDSRPSAVFSAAARAEGSLAAGTISLGFCGEHPTCYDDKCASQCGYFGTYGMFAPSVDEWIADIRTENGESWATVYGESLKVWIP